MSDEAAAIEEAIEYRVAPSVFSGTKRYRIVGARLHVDGEKTATTETMRLEDVTSVRLTMMQGLALCTLHARGGRKIVIGGRNFLGVGRFVDQHREYAAFVRALHEKLAAASPSARYVAGSNWGVAFALLVLAMTMAFLAMLFFGAVVEGKRVPFERIGPTLFVLPFGFAVAWALLRMGRAKPYDPKDPPSRFFGA